MFDEPRRKLASHSQWFAVSDRRNVFGRGMPDHEFFSRCDGNVVIPAEPLLERPGREFPRACPITKCSLIVRWRTDLKLAAW
jgi:hypothetical protein